MRAWWVISATVVLLVVLVAACGEGEETKQSVGKVAFIRDGDVWTLHLDSGQERRLTSDGRNCCPRWSADGQWISFKKVYTEEAEAQVGLWVMRDDGSDVWHVEGKGVLSEGELWAPSGHRFAYQAEDLVSRDSAVYEPINPRAWVVDPDRGARWELSVPDGEVSHLVWSPDGRQLALQVAVDEVGDPLISQGLWLTNSDGTNPRHLYSGQDPAGLGRPGGTLLLSWSPDGKYVAFWTSYSHSATSAGRPLFTIAIEGGAPTRLGEGAMLREEFIVWAPDSSRIAFVEVIPEETQIVVADPVTGDRAVVTDEGWVDSAPAWSPDGQRLAYLSEPIPPPAERAVSMFLTPQVWVMNADGSQKHGVTDALDFKHVHPQWSRDGQHILFLRCKRTLTGCDPSQIELRLSRPDGSEQREVASGLSLPEGFSFSPSSPWELFDWHR